MTRYTQGWVSEKTDSLEEALEVAPDLKKVLEQEQKLPFDELVEEAIAGMYRVDVTPEGYTVREKLSD